MPTTLMTAGYDYVNSNTDLNNDHRSISIIGAVYPTDNIRFRFGAVKSTVSGILANDEYTDFTAEVGLRF